MIHTILNYNFFITKLFSCFTINFTQLNKLLLLIFLLLPVLAFTQKGAGTAPAAQGEISYAILPGSGISFNKILADPNLNFIKDGVTQPSQEDIYWLKVTVANPSGSSGQYNMFVNPSISNTIYYFDANAQKWVCDSAGIFITPRSIKKQGGALPFILNPQAANIVYVKMNLKAVKKVAKPVVPKIQFEESSVTENQQDQLIYGWIAAVSVLLFFFLYNLYLYTSLRDASVLNYLIAQAGAMIYVTGYREFFRFLLPGNVLSFGLDKNNTSAVYYNIDNIMQHIGIMLIMLGLVQLTRSYLNTKTFLPRADRLLKFGLYFYLLASAVLIVVNTFFFYLEARTLLWDNLFLFLLISVIIYTCIAGYRQKLRAAGPFLLANVLPLVLMVCVTLFHILVSVDSVDDVWLPAMAIVSQSFCFSVALVARTKLVQAELVAKQMEAQQLTFDVQKISITMQVEKARNELLQERLDANQRELASATLYMLQKNELLANLRKQIEELQRLYPKLPHNKLSGMESVLKANLNLDDDWQKFKLHFEQLHPHFFENLRAKHPSLTNNEVRLCAYFHLNFSTKEIASLLNIEPDSVRKAKSRLYKKLGITEASSSDGLTQTGYN